MKYRPVDVLNLANEVTAAVILDANRKAQKQFDCASPGDILIIKSRLNGGDDFQAEVIIHTIQGNLGGYTTTLTTGPQKNIVVFVGYHDIIRIEKKQTPDKEVYV
ncbi:MAG: hypothetical protein AAB612_04160 [Patescibacteria group bacterium]